MNDLVNIYGDPCNKVLKGSKTNDWIKSSRPIMKDILFIGKGIATMTRDDLFKAGKAETEIVPTEKRSFCIFYKPIHSIRKLKFFLMF